MATVAPTGTWVAKGVYRTTWSGITGSGTVVIAEEGPRLPDKSIYVSGTFGGAVAGMAGTNLATGDYTEAVALTDPQGNTIAISAAGMEQILENPGKIFPTATGSSGTTDLTFTMISRGDL